MIENRRTRLTIIVTTADTRRPTPKKKKPSRAKGTTFSLLFDEIYAPGLSRTRLLVRSKRKISCSKKKKKTIYIYVYLAIAEIRYDRDSVPVENTRWPLSLPSVFDDNV